MIVGIGASEGIGIGKVFKYEMVDPIIDTSLIQHPEEEEVRLQAAIAASKEEIEAIRERTMSTMDEDTAAIFSAHLEILDDPELIGGTLSKIHKSSYRAEYALKSVSDHFVDIFMQLDNEYIRERAADIKDVTVRVIRKLQGIESSSLSDISEPIILVARDLTPSDTAQLNKDMVLGFVTDVGGRTSHSAIMARTLEIPAVVGTNGAFDNLENGQLILINGQTGEVCVNPTEEEIIENEERIRQINEEKRLLLMYKDQPSLTKDGHHLEIVANIGKPKDAEGAVENGAEGIGLYRTEFLYMGQTMFPDEEKQFRAYKDTLKRMGEKPVVIRTLDIGGDKELEYFDTPDEMNPFLGNRALRLCMNNLEIFKVQLRALIRASEHGNLHIMFPMVATVAEFRSAKAVLDAERALLIKEGKVTDPQYKVGIMIEIPSAALLADILAKEVDFFSIGTNDLIQYTYAADRMNEHVSYLYQPFNPSLLRLIKMVTDGAHASGKWVGMCGEMAGEPKALPLLIGLGLDELSMSAPSILRARAKAAEIDYEAAKILVDEAMKVATQEEVLTLVDAFLDELV